MKYNNNKYYKNIRSYNSQSYTSSKLELDCLAKDETIDSLLVQITTFKSQLKQYQSIAGAGKTTNESCRL